MARAGLLACVLAVLVGCVAGCSSQSCTAIGCADGASVTGTVPTGGNKAMVVVCLNGQCATGTTDFSDGSCADVWAAPKTLLATVCFLATQRNVWSVTGDVYAPSGTTHNGDEYSVSVRDEPSGKLLGSTDQHVSYTASHPNGADCPPTCESAQLVVS